MNTESEFYSKGVSETPNVRVSVETCEANLSEVLEICEKAIMACGFVFKGVLEIKQEDE